jgi:hypothetical protein
MGAAVMGVGVAGAGVTAGGESGAGEIGAATGGWGVAVSPWASGWPTLLGETLQAANDKQSKMVTRCRLRIGAPVYLLAGEGAEGVGVGHLMDSRLVHAGRAQLGQEMLVDVRVWFR